MIALGERWQSVCIRAILLPSQSAVKGVFARRIDHLPGIKRNILMLYTIAVVLIILWLLGMVSSFTINGFIHILLVIAIILILLRIIQGRKPL